MSELLSEVESCGVPRDIAEDLLKEPRMTDGVVRIVSGLMKSSIINHPDPAGDDLTNTRIEDVIKDHTIEKNLPPKRLKPLLRSAVMLDIMHSVPSTSSDRESRVTCTGHSKHYSNKRLISLEQVRLKDIFLRKVHEGKFFLCRIVSDPNRVICCCKFAVEDPTGDVIMVSIYNYPCVLEASIDEMRSMFPIGSTLAIREPLCKLTIQGKHPMIRVDSPSDIIFLSPNNEVLSNISWATELTHTPVLPTTAETWKARGVREFKSASMLCAAISFTEGLMLDCNHLTLLLNRSEAYLRLRWYNSARHDAEKALRNGISDAGLQRKAVYRAAKASYLMGLYERVSKLTGMLPDDKECRNLETKAKQRLKEQNTGKYDWFSAYKNARKPIPDVDIANYQGPVEVKEPVDGIRGLFVTQDVKAGELLLVGRPIASYLHDNLEQVGSFFSYNLLTGRTQKYGTAATIQKLVQSIWDNPNLALTVSAMHPGEYTKKPIPYPVAGIPWDELPPLSHPRTPLVDIDIALIEGVVISNSFDPSSSQPTFVPPDTHLGEHPTVVYELPSFCNHSCIPTGIRYFYGDVIAIHAACDLKHGEELTLSYFTYDSSSKGKEKPTRENWGFTCQCNLCKRDRIDGEARTLRAELIKTIIAEQETMSVSRIKSSMERIQKTYKVNDVHRDCGIRREMAQAKRVLANAYLRNSSKSYREAIVSLMESLEEYGIKVLDKSITGKFGRRSRDGEIVEVPRAVLPLHEEYSEIALNISSLFSSIGERKRTVDWVKASSWFCKILTGGGKSLFLEMNKDELRSEELTKVAEDALD